MELSKNGIDQFGAVELEGGRKPIKLIGLCFLISVFVAILYFNSLGNQFTNWDDGMIYENPSIRNLNWEGIKKIFTLEPGNTYQPIRMLSYAIDYRILETKPSRISHYQHSFLHISPASWSFSPSVSFLPN